MAYTLAPTPKFIALDSTGVTYPLAAVYTYAAGTLSPIDTYSDNGGTLNANPIVCDSAGRATIYLLAGVSYKFILKDTVGGSTVWTQDNILATPASQVNTDITGTAGEDLAAGDGVYLSAGDGGRVAGSWYRTDATLTYASTTATALGMAPSAITMSSTGSIRLNGSIGSLAGLTAGTLYYVSSTPGGLTSSAPANARPLCTADSTTSVVLSQFIPVPTATTTLPGIVSTTTQSFAGAKTFTGAVDCDSTFNADGAATFMSTVAATGFVTQGGIRLNRVIYSDATPHTTASAGVEAVFSTTDLTAGLLASDGMGIYIKAWGKYAATGNNKHPKLYFGGTVIFEVTAGNNNVCWSIEAVVMRTGASAESSVAHWIATGSAVNTSAAVQDTDFRTAVFDNLAVATSGAITIKTACIDTTAAAGTTQTGFLIGSLAC